MQVSIVNRSKHALPSYATPLSAGMDLRANLSEPLLLQPMQRLLVPTALYMALPPGYEAQIRPRSGMAYKKGISVANAPGTIDADYRGEIKVLVINLSDVVVEIQDGERIAQMVVAKHETVEWHTVHDLEDTERGSGGFGSTGKH